MWVEKASHKILPPLFETLTKLGASTSLSDRRTRQEARKQRTESGGLRLIGKFLRRRSISIEDRPNFPTTLIEIQML